MSRKIFESRFFLEKSDYPDSDAEVKINGFSPQYAFSNALRLLALLVEEFEHVVTEENKFKCGAKKPGKALL